MSAAPVTGEDFVSTARFISASMDRLRSLTAEQRHDDARRMVLALRGLASVIRGSQPVHGFMADLVLADGLAEIDALETL